MRSTRKQTSLRGSTFGAKKRKGKFNRPNLVLSKKTFQKNGHWIENPHPTHVLVCGCGNRYLKTRVGQAKCLRCNGRIVPV